MRLALCALAAVACSMTLTLFLQTAFGPVGGAVGIVLGVPIGLFWGDLAFAR